MGCGTSKAAPVAVDEDAFPQNLKGEVDTHFISDVRQDLTSLKTNNSIQDKTYNNPEPSKSPSSSPQVPHSNGIELPSHQKGEEEELPPVAEEKKEELKEKDREEREEQKDAPRELPEIPHSAGGRGVAFEVANSTEEGADSLIKRHPPKKFQKLEDQQQGSSLTQEILEEKQAIAEKRRQEILTQRVQSAKQRTARSAGRMRTRPGDVDDVEQFMQAEELDWLSLVNVYAINAPRGVFKA